MIGLEQHLGLFIEPAMQAWTEGQRWLIDSASWMYVNSHFVITTFTLAFIYLRRNPSFYFIRNMFMVAMGIALVLYAAYPTAPPRFMPEWGFSDSVAEFTGITASGSSADALYNPFAAVPSMHVAFALMLGVPMAAMARRRAVKALWYAYPVLVTWVVVVTGNHWWFDAAAGAAVAAVSALAAVGFARTRPAAWSWMPGHHAGAGLGVLPRRCPPRRSTGRARRRRASTRRWSATASSSRG